MASFPAPAPGDLLFYRGDPRHAIDWVIMRKTDSEWVHVAIQDDAGYVVEAVSGGVRRVPGAGRRPPDAVGRCGVTLAWLDAPRLARALAEVRGRVGDRYGMGDVVDQLLGLLPGHPALSFDRSEDCSHLAVEFLLAAGWELPFDLTTARVTPGQLAGLVPLAAR